MINGVPPNIDELKKKANCKTSWRERLSAVNELKKYDCPQSRDILTRLALSDIVYAVREEAFRATQALGVKKNGKPIYLGKKKKGNLISGITKTLTKVRNALPDDYSFEDFKSKFKELYPSAYDAYDGDKGDRFDKWLESSINSLPKKK
jgi:hypothetical protein